MYEYGIEDFRQVAAGAAAQLREAAGVVASFAQLLRDIGYAGAMPYSG